MKKFTFILMALAAGIASLGAEDIPIVGTGAGMNLLEAIVADFSKANPGISFTVPASIGSGGGITLVGKDKALIGRISRPLKESEKEFDLSYVEIAKMPIVFYANPSAGIKSLTQQQIIDIFEGKIVNWKEAGGADLPILLVKRNKGDSSLDVLQANMKGFSGENISSDATTQFTDQKALAYVIENKGAIAFGSLADATKAPVTVISVNGVEPLSKGYPYLGVLALIYKAKNLNGDLKKFLDFAASAKVNPVISKAYGIPIK
jgi:phosphate transport system substrate-binding protein